MIHEIALTIKPTMNCNMRCKHCFNGDDLNKSGILKLQKVYWFVEAACKEYKDVKITFHGGEPTLVGYEYYKKIFDFELKMKLKYGVNFSNNFTTNGLLLTDELIDLLIENNVLINISFDGPYNDYLRQDSETVFDRILRIKEKNGRVRAFCTISKGSYKNLQDIYCWFNEREIDFKILPIEPRGYASVDKKLLMDTNDFVDVLKETYKYWLKDKSCQIKFYTFEEFADLRRTTQFKPFWFNREIALNPDGKIYPFGRPNDVQFCLGEPTANFSLSDCFENENYKKMLLILKSIRQSKCLDCDSSKVCNGVCVFMSYMYVQDEALLSYSCNQSNQIFRGILDINDNVLNDFYNKKEAEYSEVAKKHFGSKR